MLIGRGTGIVNLPQLPTPYWAAGSSLSSWISWVQGNWLFWRVVSVKVKRIREPTCAAAIFKYIYGVCLTRSSDIVWC